MVLHQKEARNKNQNLIAFRIPVELSVTLRKMSINPKEALRNSHALCCSVRSLLKSFLR